MILESALYDEAKLFERRYRSPFLTEKERYWCYVQSQIHSGLLARYGALRELDRANLELRCLIRELADAGG